MATTSSDEAHRLQKMRDGSNGASYNDALLETIDNAIDEDATIIDITFKNGKLRKFYNNGNPLNSNTQADILTLDGRSKRGKANKVGKFGIGGAFARARLAGEGVQHIISKDNDIVFKAVIDLDHLINHCPIPNCWTGEHEKKPKFTKIEDKKIIEEYKNGVTLEYMGDHLNQNFALNDTVIELITKYAEFIKQGLKINVNWDSEIYTCPHIYSDYGKLPIQIEVYMDKEQTEFVYDGKTYRTSKDTRGYLKTTQVNRTLNTKSMKDIISMNVYVPSINNYNQDKVLDNIRKLIEENKKKEEKYTDFFWEQMNNNKEHINEDVITFNSTNYIIKCGNNNLDIPYVEEEDKGNKSNLHLSTLTITSQLIPNITIKYGKFTLSKISEFSRAEKNNGTFSERLYKRYRIEVDMNELSAKISQENKNICKLPEFLIKTIQEVLKKINAKHIKDVKEEFDKLYDEINNNEYNSIDETSDDETTDDKSIEQGLSDDKSIEQELYDDGSSSEEIKLCRSTESHNVPKENNMINFAPEPPLEPVPEPETEPETEPIPEPAPEPETEPILEPPKSNCLDVTEHTRTSMEKSELTKIIDSIRNYYQHNLDNHNNVNIIKDTLVTIINNKFNAPGGKDAYYVLFIKKSFMMHNIIQLLELYEYDISQRDDNEEIHGGAQMNDLYKRIFK